MSRWLDILLSIFGIIGGFWALFQIYERFKSSLSRIDTTQSKAPYKSSNLNHYRLTDDNWTPSTRQNSRKSNQANTKTQAKVHRSSQDVFDKIQYKKPVDYNKKSIFYKLFYNPGVLIDIYIDLIISFSGKLGNIKDDVFIDKDKRIEHTEIFTFLGFFFLGLLGFVFVEKLSLLFFDLSYIALNIFGGIVSGALGTILIGVLFFRYYRLIMTIFYFFIWAMIIITLIWILFSLVKN